MDKQIGRVRISFEMLADLLDFPAHWEIDDVLRFPRDFQDGTFSLYIRGADFPEKPEDGIPFECELVYNDKPEVKVRE